MVIVPGRFIFACTPRTASRSVTTALLTIPGATGKHTHDPPADLLAAKKEHGLPIVTFIRNPVTQLLSFWWNAFRCGYAGRYVVAQTARRRREQGRSVQCRTVEVISFSTYIRSTWAGRFAMKDRRLNCYHHVADEFFPYELGLKKFFEKWELSIQEIPYSTDNRAFNIPPIDPNYITEEHRALMEEHFAADVSLHQQEMARWSM